MFNFEHEKLFTYGTTNTHTRKTNCLKVVLIFCSLACKGLFKVYVGKLMGQDERTHDVHFDMTRVGIECDDQSMGTLMFLNTYLVPTWSKKLIHGKSI
jgi:CRISPR/Cas system CMR subunit Cmr6 (Cas7 group RAMP superfamily)